VTLLSMPDSCIYGDTLLYLTCIQHPHLSVSININTSRDTY
jgi:hypothetical protein